MHIGFDGNIIKSGHWYAVQVPALLVFTQAKTPKAAIARVNLALKELLESSGVEGFNPKGTHWIDQKAGTFKVFLPVNQPAIAFVLKQLRGYREMSLTDVAKKMGVSSKNAIAAYEKKGGREPTIGKLGEFFEAYNIEAQIKLIA